MATLAILDKETGDILDERKVNPGSRYSIHERTAKQDHHVATMVDDFNNKARWGKFFIDMSEYIERELTPAEWMFFTRLMGFISYEDCILRPHGHRSYACFNCIQDIADELEKPYMTCYRMMKALIAKELILVTFTGEGDKKTTRYACNPYILFRGNDINKGMYAEFNKTRWAIYNQEVLQKKKY